MTEKQSHKNRESERKQKYRDTVKKMSNSDQDLLNKYNNDENNYNFEYTARKQKKKNHISGSKHLHNNYDCETNSNNILQSNKNLEKNWTNNNNNNNNNNTNAAEEYHMQLMNEMNNIRKELIDTKALLSNTLSELSKMKND